MKGKLVLINWLISFMSMTIDTEQVQMWVSLTTLGYFVASSLLLKVAESRGWLRKIESALNKCN